MVRKATESAAAEGKEPDAAGEMPAWKRQSIDRSLQSARARAQARSDRLVATTIELMHEKGSTDFTVQDVVDRSKMSIRTFYNFFASKDDLLVAVHETVLASEVVPRLRRRCAKQSDPVKRLRAYIEGLYHLTTEDLPVSRALTVYYNRLAETRPADLERAFEPQLALVVELVRDVAEAGHLRSGLDPEKAAHLLHHTVLAVVHARILGSQTYRSVSADELWEFCAHGIGLQPSVTRRRSGR
jgi:AcrR family transcriptional regulator